MESEPSRNSPSHIGFNSGLEIHWVSSGDSAAASLLRRTLSASSVVGLDAEWKPCGGAGSSALSPPVSLLQIACRIGPGSADLEPSEPQVFLLDLQSIHLPSICDLLRDMFVSPHLLKLGFRFKQDFAYLTSTFRSSGCDPAFDRVEPFLDITNIYHYLHNKGKKLPKNNKSLAAICEEMLGVSLSKELQCSDWSERPLTEAQKLYAAADAYCLLEIFCVFQEKISSKDIIQCKNTEMHPSNATLGLKEILSKSDLHEYVFRNQFCEAIDMIKSVVCENHSRAHDIAKLTSSCRNAHPFDGSLLTIVKNYGELILLKDSDRMPRNSKRKGRKLSSLSSYGKGHIENSNIWQGPAPWDASFGGDGYPKFLCDVMVEGLAKHLRCVGIDAATPLSKRPEPRQLLDQAYKEKRVILTRDAKLLKHQYLTWNQVYQVKSLLKNDQLVEVIETFHLEISEDQLMSRCSKCNGRFIQKPLSAEEAAEAGKGFQVIPRCLYDRNIEFWQCMDCNQIYWEGTQYQNAVGKFIDICKLKN